MSDTRQPRPVPEAGRPDFCPECGNGYPRACPLGAACIWSQSRPAARTIAAEDLRVGMQLLCSRGSWHWHTITSVLPYGAKVSVQVAPTESCPVEGRDCTATDKVTIRDGVPEPAPATREIEARDLRAGMWYREDARFHLVSAVEVSKSTPGHVYVHFEKGAILGRLFHESRKITIRADRRPRGVGAASRRAYRWRGGVGSV